MPLALYVSDTVVEVGCAAVPSAGDGDVDVTVDGGLRQLGGGGLVAHSGAGLTGTSGAAPDTAFSIDMGVPDSQYTLGASWTTRFDSIDAIRDPAVAPSCSDAFWKAR